MEDRWASQDLIANVDADLDFHGLIVSACSNVMLRALYQTFRAAMSKEQV